MRPPPQILDWRGARSWRRIGVTVAVVLGFALITAGGTAQAAVSTQTARPVITIKDFTFQGALEVLAGEKVVVRNADSVKHTLTAVNGSFTTKTIQPGKSATFRAPKGLGTYGITCKFHPDMRGVLGVGVRPPQHPVITIRNFAYEGDLTVRPGAMVTVNNADTAPHTLTAVDGSFTTPVIPGGGSATFRAPKTFGTFAVTCTIHPRMAGTLKVSRVAVPPPPPPPPPEPPPPPVPVINIQGFAYHGQLSVMPGVSVLVRNEDMAPHTLTAVDRSFTTATISGGGSGTFNAPTAPGSYPITCLIHPSMSGTLTVAAAHQHH